MTGTAAPTGPNRLPAVILAGGAGRRMGGVDKALLPLAGRPLIRHVIDRLSPQAAPLAINTIDAAAHAAADLPILPDGPWAGQGPLAGILAALRWAAELHPVPDRVLTVPCDTPFLPPDLVARLAARGEGIVRAASRGRGHPVIALWPVGLAPALEAHLARPGPRAVTAWAERFPVATVPFADAGGEDPFRNLNTPEDLSAAEAAFSHPPRG